MDLLVTIEYSHLIGRPFELGRFDCFTIVRDFYRDNFGIEICNYARPKDWSSDKVDIMGLAHEREGFSKVENWTIRDLRPGDLLCIAIGTSAPNHFAVYVGDNKIIHHLSNSLSTDETLRDFYRMTTCYVLRHKDVPDLRPSLPTTSIQELIDARNRVEAEA